MSEPCPSCGSYRVIPHCRSKKCPGLWCSRAECMWENFKICTEAEPTAAAQHINFHRMERLTKGRKMQYLPVKEIGIFKHGKDGEFMPATWKFVDNKTDRFGSAFYSEWPVDELRSMYLMFRQFNNLTTLDGDL